MSVSVGKSKTIDGWFIAPLVGDLDLAEFHGITAQLLAIIFGFTDPVEIYDD